MVNQNEQLILLVYLAVQASASMLSIVIVALLAKWVYSFLVVVFSSDGDWNWREQRHRHRRENFVLGMSVACLITGTLLSINGYSEGAINVRLPGGFAIDNAGIGVVLLGVMCFIVWVLLRLPQPSQELVDVAASVAPARPQEQSVVSLTAAPAFAGLFANMTYAKAGLITVVLLPFLQGFAILIGGYLLWKAWKQQQIV